jgi:glycerophosphoryl diester phosphodiesterase
MTEIISHRGGALLWPENSRTACENTVRLGVEQLQVDVHPSRDGRVVVLHDATLERTTDGAGEVAGHDWDALSRLVLKGTDGQRMLLLEEVAAMLRDTPVALRLEVKPDAQKRPYPGFPRLLGDLLSGAGIRARSIVTGFQVATVAETAEAAPGSRPVWLVSADVLAERGIAEIIRIAGDHAIAGLGLRWKTVDPEILARVRGSSLGIGCFGCNDAESLGCAFSLGVDEVMTDRPDLALRLRREADAGSR